MFASLFATSSRRLPSARSARSNLPLVRFRLRRARTGFTLVEMLVTIAVTLILVFGLVQMFQWIGERVADGRGVIEMAGSLRGVANRLQKDLDSVTVPVRPWPEQGSASGYFEIFEGASYDGATAPADTLTGDLDDGIMFTAFSVGEPFTAQVMGQLPTIGGRPTLITNPAHPAYNAAGGSTTTITSSVAEIIWWSRFEDTNGDGVRNDGEVQTLHRRVLLVRPDIDLSVDPTLANRTPVEFFNSFDLSARRLGSGAWVANSLDELTERVNRFAHSATFPHVLDGSLLFAKSDLTWALPPGLQSSQQGEDVMLAQVLSFDVRVYDPYAQVLQYDGDPSTPTDVGGDSVSPGDPGWTNAKNAGVGTVIGMGAYVDLNYRRLLNGPAQTALTATDFSHAPQIRSQLQANPTYCTWSSTYERDGVNQDQAGFVPPAIADTLIDESIDGLDNDGFNGTDDVGERETSPPYPVPLRGVRVSIRVYEPDTRQIRQQAVVAKFVPE